MHCIHIFKHIARFFISREREILSSKIAENKAPDRTRDHEHVNIPKKGERAVTCGRANKL